MKARPGAALVLLALLLGLGAAACGGGGSAAKTTTTSAAQQRLHRQAWRAGMVRWHRSTQHALNGISVIFSTEASLVEIGKHDSKTSASLARYDQVLIACSATVRRLGVIPTGLEVAGRYAHEACVRLEKGERGVQALVGELRKGQGFDTLDPLTGAGELLSEGQADLTTVVHALNDAPD